jgi:2-polyprenyl-6-methoxyphenol hydroxylase-like FAD-dependent oxidoreductase
MKNKPILIIGAGPAGLTAGIELQRSGFTNVTILESGNWWASFFF